MTPIYEQLRAKIIEAVEDKSKFIKPTHGTCCTCQRCGHDHDDCLCRINDDLNLEDILVAIQSKITITRHGREIQEQMNSLTNYYLTPEGGVEEPIWQLNLPLSQQSNDLHKFLNTII